MTIKVRDMEVRLTRNKEERKLVRQLRYRVFIEEEGETAPEEQKMLREEYDAWDTYSDYMAIFHGDAVVGCYRIITRESAEKMGGFFSEEEFDISKIKKVRGNIAEMSRACIAPEYRNNPLAISLMWLGLGEYISRRKISLIFGMASWFRARPMDYAMATSYLYYNCLAPKSLRTKIDFDKVPDDVTPATTRMNIIHRDFIDKEAAYAEMNPVLKGYLRLGAKVGLGVAPANGHPGSYSVLVVMKTADISRAYQKKFAGAEDAYADLALAESPIKKFGKIMLMPVTGPFKLLKMIGKSFGADDETEYVNS